MFCRKITDATCRMYKHARRKDLLYPFAACVHSNVKSSTQFSHNENNWITTVSEAENVVGSLTSFLSPWDTNDEKMAIMVRKCLESTRTLVKTGKELHFNGRNKMQPWGLIVLLLSKTAGQLNVKMTEEEMKTGVLHSQCVLVEMIELIHNGVLIHKCLVNIPQESYAEEAELKQLTLNNHMALLSGDYLLAVAFSKYDNLRNQEITTLISSALGDTCQEEFFGRRDLQNKPLPSAEDVKDAKDYWTRSNMFSAASLLGKACQGSMKLAGQSADLQEQAYEFGKHLALAWQASLEVEPFLSTSSYAPGSAFDLGSAPVVFHLQHDSTLFEEIEKGINSIEDVDYEKVHQRVINGPGVKLSKSLQKEHLQQAMEILSQFKESDAQRALRNIIVAMNNL